MSEAKFLELARQYFAYLEEHGFQVVQEIDRGSGVAEQHWESGDCRISVDLDRGQVVLRAGPLAPPDLWYDMGDVVEYLTHGADKWAYEFPPVGMSYEDQLRRQFDRLVPRVRPYCDKIGPLFRPDVFPETRRALDRLMGLG